MFRRRVRERARARHVGHGRCEVHDRAAADAARSVAAFDAAGLLFRHGLRDGSEAEHRAFCVGLVDLCESGGGGVEDGGVGVCAYL